MSPRISLTIPSYAIGMSKAAFSEDTFLTRTKKVLGLGPDDSPTVWLTRAYILAFLLIGALTIFSHNIMAYLTARQIEGKEVAYHLGQEIGFIREIGNNAKSYYLTREEFDRYAFMKSYKNLKQSHEVISRYLENIDYFNTAKNTLNTNFRAEPFNLDEKLNTYFKTVDKYASYGADSTSPDRKETLEALKSSSEDTLPKLLDIALTDYQSVQIREMQNLYRIEGYAALGVIVVIFLEALFIFRPLAKKVEEYHSTILRQALEDPLTGLKNRRAFMKDLEVYEKAVQREKQKYVFAICDLDKFKHINDTYGHAAGDSVLKHFAQIMEDSLRPSDIVARMGGEEFAIVLTNTSSKQAAQVLDRIRETTEKTPCQHHLNGESSTIKYTTSIGFIEGFADGRDNSELLRLADEALYVAKQEGRNRIHEMKRGPVPVSATPAASA